MPADSRGVTGPCGEKRDVLAFCVFFYALTLPKARFFLHIHTKKRKERAHFAAQIQKEDHTLAEKLKIIPLGGLNEIGKNMTVYEFAGEIIVVDCGMAFPGDDMYGIDCVIPDVSYLIKHKNRIRGLFITHGHEDHIGAIPYVLKQVNMPIYCTALTAGLIRLKLEEHGLTKSTKLTVVEAGDTVRAGHFGVEFIHVNHSIADSVAFAIHTGLGTVVHTGDFKLDSTPIDGEVIDLARLGELGKRGVLALLSDSTNVERPGYTMSERTVGKTFDRLFGGCKKRIIVTTFASNVHRIQQVIDAAAACGRKVAVTGRSMENIMRVSTELGYMKLPKNTVTDISKLKSLPPEKQIIVTTGSQGEEMSALYRMAFSQHKQIDLGPTDRVIISASPIPGNEKMVSRVINELVRKGVEVVYDRADALHVSGHACQEELKIMHALTRPRFFIPLHGEQRHLKRHVDLAIEMGMDANRVAIAENGAVIEITAKTMKCTAGAVAAGEVFVDGAGVGDVGAVVLRDRRHLAEDGMVVVVIPLSAQNGELLAEPEIVTRGFIYVKESEELLEELGNIAMSAAETLRRKRSRDDSELKGAVKSAIGTYLYRTTKRSPMIIPVITRL
ncbi:MAG: ribonuclease J [Oscillospiraceae bacterium]|nr:ribonuclease J [Oscillospiraceae bacterium]